MDTSDLSQVFTYASYGAYETPELLFGNVEGTPVDLTDESAVCELADKILDERIYKDPFIITTNCNWNSEPTLIATTDFRGHAIHKLENCTREDMCYIVVPENRSIEVARLVDVFSACPLPEKHMIGCQDCYRTCDASDKSCKFKQLKDVSGGGSSKDARDLKQMLTNRKDKIGDYTFVSPALTSPDYFQPTFRRASEHDFSCIPVNSDTRTDALKERYRHLKFRKQVCPDCFMDVHCNYRKKFGSKKLVWSNYGTGTKYCEGPYPHKTEKEAAEAVLEKVNIPFSNKTLKLILSNLGELERKIERCEYHASLETTYPDNVMKLVFIRRTHTPQKIYIDPRKALAALKAGNPTTFKSWNNIRLTKQHKALICCAADISRGPHRGGWGSAYPVPISLSQQFNHDVKINYTSYSGGRHTWPSNTTVSSLQDFYANWGYVPFLDKTNHKLGRNGRY